MPWRLSTAITFADNELTRRTIQTQLEAARWLDFDHVKAV
jgi:hypothetical protein